MDTTLEAMVIPVADVDRAKAFYTKLAWRLDAGMMKMPPNFVPVREDGFTYLELQGIMSSHGSA